MSEEFEDDDAFVAWYKSLATTYVLVGDNIRYLDIQIRRAKKLLGNPNAQDHEKKKAKEDVDYFMGKQLDMTRRRLNSPQATPSEIILELTEEKKTLCQGEMTPQKWDRLQQICGQINYISERFYPDKTDRTE